MGCFVAQKYQYLNSGLLYFFLVFHSPPPPPLPAARRRMCVGKWKNPGSRNKHRHLAMMHAVWEWVVVRGGRWLMGVAQGGRKGGEKKTPAVCSKRTHAVSCGTSSQTLPPRSSYLVRGQKNRCNTRVAQILQQTVTSRIDGFLGAPPETLVTFLNARRSTVSHCLGIGERMGRHHGGCGPFWVASFWVLFFLDDWISS